MRTNEEKRWFGRIEDALVLRVMSLRRVSLYRDRAFFKADAAIPSSHLPRPRRRRTRAINTTKRVHAWWQKLGENIACSRKEESDRTRGLVIGPSHHTSHVPGHRRRQVTDRKEPGPSLRESSRPRQAHDRPEHLGRAANHLPVLPLSRHLFPRQGNQTNAPRTQYTGRPPVSVVSDASPGLSAVGEAVKRMASPGGSPTQSAGSCLRRVICRKRDTRKKSHAGVDQRQRGFLN